MKWGGGRIFLPMRWASGFIHAGDAVKFLSETLSVRSIDLWKLPG